jgi:peptide-methionine (S)-S-oxide reductase
VLFSRLAKTRLVTPDEALPGRAARPYAVPATHAVLGTPLEGPWPEGLEVAYFALGCFWGAERVFWQTPGVYSTAVGYQGGSTPHPTYDEVCTGMTGHTEAVQVVYDPAVVSYRALVKRFLEAHDPTQGYRQGNDTGTQYRSALYWTSAEQQAAAEELVRAYQAALDARGYGSVTTEVAAADGRAFYYAEDYHQQYLYKVPNGYCGLGGTGVACPL